MKSFEEVENLPSEKGKSQLLGKRYKYKFRVPKRSGVGEEADVTTALP